MANKGENFEDTLADVIRFIERKAPTGCKKITAHTDLCEDLRMDHEDAYYMLVKFFDSFGVSDGDFDWTRYLLPEDTILMALLRLLFRKRRHKPVKLVRLTIGMLAGAARDGIWRTEALEREFGS